MKKLFLVALVLLTFKTYSQNKTIDEAAIKTTINNLFDGMRKADTALISSAFSSQAIMQSIAKNKDGMVNVRQDNTSKFIASMAGNHPLYDEKIKFNSILIDGDLAAVWTDYQFFVDGKFSHCGVNSFQLAKTDKGWKIIYIIDTRRKDNCPNID